MISSLDLDINQQKVDDIFQVSINSTKLISILKKFEDKQSQLLLKIQRIDDYYKQGDSALNKKIINIQSNIKKFIKDQIELIKIDTQSQLRKYQEKHIKQIHDKQSKLNQLKYSIQTLNDKINKVNSNLTQEIQNSIRNYSTQNFSLKRSFQKAEDQNHGTFDDIFDKLESFKSDIEYSKENIFDMEIKVKKFTQLILRPSQSDKISFPQKKFEESINGQKYANFLQTEGSIFQRHKTQNKSPSKQKSRSKKPINKSSFMNTGSMKRSRLFKPATQEPKKATENYMSTLQYASISAKLQNLQKTFQQKTQKNDNDQKSSLFKRGCKTNMMKTFSYSKQDFEKCDKSQTSQINYEEMQDYEIVTNIFNKLEAISQSVEQKQNILKKTMDEIKQKQLISSQKIDFMKQKLTKMNSQISQLKIKLLSVQKKSGQSTEAISISNIETQLGKLIQRLDKQCQTKLQVEEFEKQKVKTIQKFAMIQQNLVDKAQKGDVKKAINFLQDKIKQIILVIANQFNEQKLGAINKQPVKCLTCDKQILKLDNISNVTQLKGLSNSKSSRDITQKYYTRLLKSKKQNRAPTKRLNQNYTSVTQVTEEKQQIINFI